VQQELWDRKVRQVQVLPDHRVFPVRQVRKVLKVLKVRELPVRKVFPDREVQQDLRVLTVYPECKVP
jgi:hypothetical protein